jgi:putative FmdB family regulatory protein
MPTYEYKCPSCEHFFEEFQSITENPIEKCPECGEKTQRVISGGAGFVLKGSGFYQTDYRSSQYKSDASKDKPAETSSKSSDSKSTSDKSSDKKSPTKSDTSSKSSGATKSD